MILRSAFLQRQKGAVLVLVALGLVLVLMGVAALAIDLSHAEVNKTRLQNLADELALSAAISLNKQESGTLPCDTTKSSSDKEQYAEYYAKYCSFPKFTAASGNAEVNSAIANTNLAFTFSSTTDLSSTSIWWDNSTPSANNNATFVRVVVSPMNVSTWFARIMGFNNVAVSASAVAGLVPIAPCDVAPLMMCSTTDATTEEDDGDGTVDGVDKDCSDGDCYGYTVQNVYCMVGNIGSSSSRCDASKNSAFGAGNMGLVNFGNAFPSSGLSNGASTVKKCLAGDPLCKDFCELTTPGVIPAKTGSDWGPVREGIDSLFNEDNPELDYPSDTITGLGTAGGLSTADTYLSLSEIVTATTYGTTASPVPTAGIPYTSFNTTTFKNPYTEYQSFANSVETGLSSDAKYKQRIIGVPMVNCTDLKNGVDPNIPVVGYGCFFLTARAQKFGSEEIILGQFLDSTACSASGKPITTNNYDFYKVQLYKDPFSGWHS